MIKPNNMMLDIEQTIYYARYDSGIPVSDQNIWWFCVLDHTIYEQQVLFDSFGYHSVSEITESGNYILFAQIDVLSLESRYLSEYHPTECKKTTLIKTDQDFKVFIDHNNEWLKWADFEKQALRSGVMQWCKEHAISYY